MECIVGIRFDDFVMIAADANQLMGGLLIAKDDQHKFFNLTSKMVMATIGEAGDMVQFAEYIQKNIHLYKIRNGYEMSPAAAANFTRYNLTKSLRSRSPYAVNMMMGGYDDMEGTSLYHMDYLGAMIKCDYAAFGYGGMLTLSIMDRYKSTTHTREDAYQLMEKCITEIHNRLVINIPNFKVVIIGKNGVEDVSTISAKGLASKNP
ncbi:proteasome subunit beta type-2-like [Arctopsyche grandis]|uniref:proteasome subunit beta type-2-like n=1 Tax=Arctopsyche grandis TaxID=121162 RepID=UPI00406D7BEA